VGPLGQPSLAADDAADAGDLLAERLAAVGERVERDAQLAGDSRSGGREPERELAVACCLERVQELLELGFRDDALVGGGLRSLRPRPPFFWPCLRRSTSGPTATEILQFESLGPGQPFDRTGYCARNSRENGDPIFKLQIPFGNKPRSAHKPESEFQG
jgi:hypothetical protein